MRISRDWRDKLHLNKGSKGSKHLLFIYLTQLSPGDAGVTSGRHGMIFSQIGNDNDFDALKMRMQSVLR